MASWIKSHGGPLICIEKRLAMCWQGASARREQNPTTTLFEDDYERACGVSDYVGKLDVANGEALILGDMPLQTMIWEFRKEFPKIVRVIYADPDSNVIELLESVGAPSFLSPTERIDFEVKSEELVVFDSAYSGGDMNQPRLCFRLPPGRYAVLTEQFEPDERTSLIVHEFVSCGY